MTVAEIKALAAQLGYSVTKAKKADIITEFLEQEG
nr:MAG TPA: HeH/LEM domain [Caudoviricetes sp.]